VLRNCLFRTPCDHNIVLLNRKNETNTYKCMDKKEGGESASKLSIKYTFVELYGMPWDILCKTQIYLSSHKNKIECITNII